MSDVARALKDNFTSVNVPDRNFEPANVVDVIDRLAMQVGRVADAIGRVADALEAKKE